MRVVSSLLEVIHQWSVVLVPAGYFIIKGMHAVNSSTGREDGVPGK